jgi:hypothetical protein
VRDAAAVRTENVDWSQLSTAYGPATDVPELLTRLHSGQASTRQEAIDDLWSALCHQETVYEASAVAVPFLFESARKAPLTSPERHQLLALIACIGRGEDSCWDGYVPWQTVERCSAAVEAVLPDVAAWAAAGGEEARTWSVVLSTYFPGSFRRLHHDPMRWLTTLSPEVAELVRLLVTEVEPEPADVAAAAAVDDDTLDWLQQGLVDQPPTRQGRQVVWDLAEKGLL